MEPSLSDRRPRPRIETLADLIFGLSLSICAIGVIVAAFAHVISLEERKLVARALAELFGNGRNRLVVLAVLVAVSIAPQFWEWTLLGVPTRLYVWYVPLVSYWVGRVLRPASRTYRRS